MSTDLFGLATAGVFVLLVVLAWARFGKPTRDILRGGPDRKEVAVVVVALLFAAGLLGLAVSPYASMGSIIGLAMLGNGVVLALSIRRRRQADSASQDAQ